MHDTKLYFVGNSSVIFCTVVDLHIEWMDEWEILPEDFQLRSELSKILNWIYVTICFHWKSFKLYWNFKS